MFHVKDFFCSFHSLLTYNMVIDYITKKKEKIYEYLLPFFFQNSLGGQILKY